MAPKTGIYRPCEENHSMGKTGFFAPGKCKSSSFSHSPSAKMTGVRGLGKVDKVYLDNTNLVYSLAENNADIGNLRETFFFNQMRVNNSITTSSVGDFKIRERVFEVGGRSKGKRQIQGAAQGFVVKDGIEFSSGNILPLWWFGLNY